MRRMGFLFYWDNISLAGFQDECFLLQKVTSVQAVGWVLAAGYCWLTYCCLGGWRVVSCMAP